MKRNKMIEQQLHKAQQALQVALDDQSVAALLAAYGYDEAKLAAGQTLHDKLAQAVQQQRLSYGAQYEATATLHMLRAEAELVYGHARQVARVAFKDDEDAQTGLSLAGRMPTALSGWLLQAAQFYESVLANPDWLAMMAEFGYEQSRLQAELAQVEAVEQAYNWRQKLMAQARASTQLRDVQADHLKDWMEQFAGIARIALQDVPAALGKLDLS